MNNVEEQGAEWPMRAWNFSLTADWSNSGTLNRLCRTRSHERQFELPWNHESAVLQNN